MVKFRGSTIRCSYNCNNIEPQVEVYSFELNIMISRQPQILNLLIVNSNLWIGKKTVSVYPGQNPDGGARSEKGYHGRFRQNQKSISRMT